LRSGGAAARFGKERDFPGNVYIEVVNLDETATA